MVTAGKMKSLGLTMLGIGMMLDDPAQAQKISGEVGLYNKYLDYDVLVLTDEPVVQAALYAQISDECTFMAWGSHGVATRVGGELDVGPMCEFEVADKTKISVYGMRSFLRDFQDSWTVSAGISHGPAALTVERYYWDNNPNGWRMYGSYTLRPTGQLTFQPLLVYETGLGLPDIVAGGANAEYALTPELSLVAMGLAPLHEGKGDFRKAQLLVGTRLTF